jgi:hypothetical protein
MALTVSVTIGKAKALKHRIANKGPARIVTSELLMSPRNFCLAGKMG